MPGVVDDADVNMDHPCDESWTKGVEWGFRLDDETDSDSRFETKLGFKRQNNDDDDDDGGDQEGDQGGSSGQDRDPVFGDGGSSVGPPPRKSKNNSTVSQVLFSCWGRIAYVLSCILHLLLLNSYCSMSFISMD
jgi:hypothetical protein